MTNLDTKRQDTASAMFKQNLIVILNQKYQVQVHKMDNVEPTCKSTQETQPETPEVSNAESQPKYRTTGV